MKVSRSPCSLVLTASLTWSAAALAAQGEPPLRVALRARNGGADRLTPLRYIGGFETKTLVYETLVKRGQDGRIVPGLASQWAVDQDGKTFHFQIREGARFHDGTAVTPDAIRVHFKRWVGLPEHDWLLANARIEDVQVEGEHGFKITTDQPYSLLADLCVINPCAIVGPGARDWEGEFQRPMGTGPFRFVAALDGGKRWRLERAGSEGPGLEIAFFPRGRDTAPIDALTKGEIDAFVGGWDEDLPAESLDALAKDERFRVQTAKGSSVVYLSFLLNDGPTSDVAVRQRIAAAIDRAELVKSVEGGRADECTTWAAPSIAFWPRPLAPAKTRPEPAAKGSAPLPKLRVAAARREGRAARVAAAVVDQLAAAGFEVEIVPAPARREGAEPERKPGVGDSGELTARPSKMGTVDPERADSGEARAAANRTQRLQSEQADIRVDITHGSPYDPHQALVARFGPQRRGERARTGVDPRLFELVTAVSMIPDEMQCIPVYAQIQDHMDRQALIVPLYSPWRVALHTAGVEGIRMGCDVYSVDLTGFRRVAKAAADGSLQR